MKQVYLFLLYLPSVFLFVFLFFHSTSIFSQTTPLSGAINKYYAVAAIDPSNESLMLNRSANSFQTNDEVLIIQMQGGTLDQSNDANFGDITQLGSTGLMERATVCNTSGNILTFQNQLANTYDDPASTQSLIQVVKFSTYQDVRVTGTLTAPAWNGSTGGVLVLSANGNIDLQADINMSGLGMRRGAIETTASGCGNFPWPVFSDYAYAQIDQAGSKKGEGIVPYIAGKEYGKGTQANGGGGANDHNAGGAGGGNWGAGGQGGEKTTGGSFICLGNEPGIGGRSLQSYLVTSDRLFLGGGGGAGNDNDGQAGEAGNGGGIIIIIANDIESNGFSISARGDNAAASTGDGGSGGGAGGSILLSTNSFGINPMILDVSGGNGGNAGIAANCLGPGGGGGGGLIRTASPLTANVTSITNGGNAGIVNPTVVLPCAGTSNFAAAGQNGNILNSASITAGSVPGSCVLVVDDKHIPLVDQLPQEMQLSVYPNPSTPDTDISLDIHTPHDSWISLSLLDGAGRNIYQHAQKLTEGREIISIPNVGLAEGIYYLRVILDARLYTYPLHIRKS